MSTEQLRRFILNSVKERRPNAINTDSYYNVCIYRIGEKGLEVLYQDFPRGSSIALSNIYEYFDVTTIKEYGPTIDFPLEQKIRFHAKLLYAFANNGVVYAAEAGEDKEFVDKEISIT